MGWVSDKLRNIYNNCPSMIVIVIVTVCLAVISPFVYILFLFSIGNFQFMSEWPFKSLIAENFYWLRYGIIILPFTTIVIGLLLARKRYMNIMYRKYN